MSNVTYEGGPLVARNHGFRRTRGNTLADLAIVSNQYGRVEVGNLALSDEGDRTSAVLLGKGTSTTPTSIGTNANKNFLGFWMRSNATTGDTRGMYIRLYIGAAGSGEALRAYATIDGANAATGGTVNGAHISTNITGSGTVSGQANAIRATLDVAQDLTPGGTLAAITAEFVAGTGVTLPTNRSLIRLVDSANTSIGYAFSVPTVASGGMFAVHTTQTLSHSIRIISAAGTVYYIMCTDAATNRTGGA